MEVLQKYIENSLDNFNYIAYSEKTQKAIHFDPYDIGQTLDQKQLDKIKKHFLVNTHKHPDHIKDNLNLVMKTGAEKISLRNGDRFYLSDEEYIEALDTPGHTADHQCFLVYDGDGPFGIIAGDVLFNCGVGNCRMGGDVNILYETITKIIKRLPEHLKLFTSHDYMLNNLAFAETIEPDNKAIFEYREKYHRGDILTLGDEKKYNPFLRTEKESIQKRFPHKSEKEIFIELRKMRDNW